MVEAFAWYLHEVKQKARLTSADIGPCFDAVHVRRPSNIASVLSKLCDKKPTRLIKDSGGFRLSSDARRQIGALLPVRASSVKTTRELNDLLVKITDPVQKTFLTETLLCFKHQAYRAAVVMAWNLAYSDLIERILVNHMTAFNAHVGTHNFKRPVANRTDFEDLREGQVLTLARNAHILGKESYKTLDEKLGKRNTAAHPSNVVVNAATAEEMIFDLVQNIILKTPL
jgi:hypothetical protein